jgi:hypothetical protein
VPDVAGLVRVIHAPVGILFVGSLIGRWVALGGLRGRPPSPT